MSILCLPHSNVREMLPTPAPFVFGGSFSDYLKEGNKFARFSTLTSLAHGRIEDMGELAEDPDDVNTLYAAAREQGIGTVDHIAMPEGSLNIVNLVDIARFIEKSWGLSSGDDDEQDAEADECNAEDEEADTIQAECPSDCSTRASTMDVDIPKPVVYSGTFQEYMKEASKFTRFSTLSGFTEKVCVETPPPQSTASSASFELLSTRVPDILADITSQIEATEPHQIIEGLSPEGYVSCQLLALCSPPSKQKEQCVFTTLSDAIVQRNVNSTMAGAKRSMTMLAANACAQIDASESREDPVPSTTHADPKEVFIPVKQDWSKFSSDRGMKDDGSGWNMCSSLPRGPVAFAGSRRRSFSQRSSGASWGAAGELLEPICQEKVSFDQSVKVTIPKFPGRAVHLM